jgi:nitronate monooxygenase
MARVANNMAAKLTLEMEARGTTLQELIKSSRAVSARSVTRYGNVDGGYSPGAR